MYNKSFKCSHFMVSLNLGKHNFWILRKRKTNAIISLLAQRSKNRVFLLPAPHTKEMLLDIRSWVDRSTTKCRGKALLTCVLTSQCPSDCSHTNVNYNALTLNKGLRSHRTGGIRGTWGLGEWKNWVLRTDRMGLLIQLTHELAPAAATLKQASQMTLIYLPFPHNFSHKVHHTQCLCSILHMVQPQGHFSPSLLHTPSAASNTPLPPSWFTFFLTPMTPDIWVFSTLIPLDPLLTPHLPPNLFSHFLSAWPSQGAQNFKFS